VVLAFAAYFVFMAGRWVVTTFGSLKPEVLWPTLVGFLTVSGSVIAVVLAKHIERKREIEFELRKKKAAVYDEFMRVFFEIIYASKTKDKAPSEQETTKALTDLTILMIPWASDSVIAKYSSFRHTLLKGAASNEGIPRATILMFEEVLFEIRTDLGHKNSKLQPGDLLRLYINDLDSYLGSPPTKK
jgi:hypothetical protein